MRFVVYAVSGIFFCFDNLSLMKSGRNIQSAVAICIGIFLWQLLFPVFVFSGEWRVKPIRLFFDQRTKTGAITVINEGASRLRVQMEAFEWTQDEGGENRYTETSDIIFYPKIMVLERNEERIIRAGVKMPALARERTYRLFIEETPDRNTGEGPAVTIAIRFGVPIFVKPLRAETRGEIGAIELAKGTLTIPVKNTGNVHFRINTIDIRGKNAKGEETFSRDLRGWYILNGISRLFSASIPRDACMGSDTIEVQVKADTVRLNGKFNIDRQECAPQ